MVYLELHLERLLIIFGVEIITFSILFLSLLFYYTFRKLFPDLDKHVKQNVDTTIYSEDEEGIYDTGFLEDISNYDARIDDLKEQLKQTKGASPFLPNDIFPPVEIITDDYEKSLENK